MRVVFNRRLFTCSGLLTQRMEVARPIRPGARSPRTSPGQELRLGRKWAVRYSIWCMRGGRVSALMDIGWETGLIAACPLAVCQAALGAAWQPSLRDGAWPVAFWPGRSCRICPSVHAQCSACFAWPQTSPQEPPHHTRPLEGPSVALRALFSLPADDEVLLSLIWTRKITFGFRRPSVA